MADQHVLDCQALRNSITEITDRVVCKVLLVGRKQDRRLLSSPERMKLSLKRQYPCLTLSDKLQVDFINQVESTAQSQLRDADLVVVSPFLPDATPSGIKNRLNEAGVKIPVIYSADPCAEILPPSQDRWQWRYLMAERIAASGSDARFGIRQFYICGSVKNAAAGPESDIDLIVHCDGDREKQQRFLQWIESWSHLLSDMYYLHSGIRVKEMIDVHLVTDDDLVQKTSWAVKIGAITDGARPIP